MSSDIWWGVNVAGGVSGTLVNKVWQGSGTHDSTTPLVIGAFFLTPSVAGFMAKANKFTFRATCANGKAALTNTIKLYNVTDSEEVASISVTDTAAAKGEVALTVGSNAGDLKTTEKLYEVRLALGADPAGDPLAFITAYSAELSLEAY